MGMLVAWRFDVTWAISYQLSAIGYQSACASGGRVTPVGCMGVGETASEMAMDE